VYPLSNVMVDAKMITITGDDYAGWGNDDTYIVDYVLRKFGLTRLS